MSDLLSHEETTALIKKAQEGDAEAKETLVVRNIALVKSIVRGFLSRGAEYDDLVQIGSVGLIKAIDGYDPAFGVRFSTYAVPMIAGEIKRFLRDDGMVKVSRSVKERSAVIMGARERLKRRLMREPDIGELSAETGIEREEIVYAMEATQAPVSLHAPVFGEDEGTELLDTLKSDDETKLIDRLFVDELLGKLSERERRVVVLRFFADRTQSEIAGDVGVSQVQVSRILTKTLEKLKKACE